MLFTFSVKVSVTFSISLTVTYYVTISITCSVTFSVTVSVKLGKFKVITVANHEIFILKNKLDKHGLYSVLY